MDGKEAGSSDESTILAEPEKSTKKNDGTEPAAPKPTAVKRAHAEERDFVDDKLSSSPSTSAPASSESTTLSSKRARHNWSIFSKKLRSLKKGKPAQLKTVIFNIVKDDDFDDERSMIIRLDDFSLRFEVPILDSSFKDLAEGFDNTGNVSIWPGSEALAWLILKEYLKFENVAGRCMFEMGSGFLGLPGFAAGKMHERCEVFVTDGNCKNIDSLEAIVERNAGKTANVEAEHLSWGKTTLDSLFDPILAADCIFFENSHEPFMKCVDEHLTKEGTVFMSCPRRRGSLEKFKKYVESSWSHKFEIVEMKDLNKKIEEKLRGRWEKDAEIDEYLPIITTIKRRIKNGSEEA